MKFLLKIPVVVMLLLSCKGSTDNRAQELANDMYGCFDGFQNSLSEDGKRLMKAVSTAAKPQEVLMAGMAKLKPEVAKVFTELLKNLGDKNSMVFKCMQNFDKKHANETTADKNELTGKLLMEMQKRGNCHVGAAIINLNPKQE